MHLGQLRAFVVALMTSGLISLGASPEMAVPRVFQAWTTLQNSARVSGDSLEVESAQGTLMLPPEIAPPSQRAWQLSDDPAPVVDGRIVDADGGAQLLIERATLHFAPAREGARGEPARDPGAALVVIEPDQPAEPCSSGRGLPATAEISYDSGDGRVEKLTEAIHMACSDYGDDRVVNAADFTIWRTNH